MTKRELIQFMDELVELASEENKTRAILVKERFISGFEKSYEYEKEVQTEISYLPPYYIATMPDSVQEEIKQKVIAGLTHKRSTISCWNMDITLISQRLYLSEAVQRL